MPTIQELEELKEECRVAGNRDKFLEIKKQIEVLEQEKVLRLHKEKLANAISEFPKDLYIPEMQTKVIDIKDGCGTKSGWIEIYLSGYDKSIEVSALRNKIRTIKKEQSAREYFEKLKFSDKRKSLYIGENTSETLELLIKVMGLDLPILEDIDEYNMYYLWEVMNEVKKDAIEDGYTDDEADEKAEEAEQKVRDEIFKDYTKSILRTVNYLFDFHGLELVELKKRCWIVVKESWHDAANKVARTITGYGMFEYNSGKELRDVGPYKNYCKAVVDHLHWLRRYTEVFGGADYRKVYER